jgi:hypothetical protein
MKRSALVLFTLALAAFACVRSTGGNSSKSPVRGLPPTPPPVPAEFQSTAAELNAELAHFESTLDQSPAKSPSGVIVATELAYANGNIADGLLSAGTMDRNRSMLDRLQAMGVRGVVIQISFPLLDPAYPRSEEYLKFFKDIVAEVHNRSMKVLVESGVMFANTPYSPAKIDWSAYTTQSLLQGRESQVLRIAKEIRPDYLMIGNEPTTEEMLTGLTITAADWGNFLGETLGKIDRSGGTLIGSGVGTWEDVSYFNRVMQLQGLDFIDLHVYPPGQDGVLLDRALNDAGQARAAGKRVTISESWLYKIVPQEGKAALGNYSEAYNRDVFSFWEPLDERFLMDMTRLADTASMDFISFFWSRYFFAYLDYNTTPKGQTTELFNRQINQASLAAVESDSLSSLGYWLENFLQERNGTGSEPAG